MKPTLYRGSTNGRSLREYIFRHFMLYSAAVVGGAALLVFATHKFTEDAAMRQLLETLATPAPGQKVGVFTGTLDAMPAMYRSRLADSPVGMSELPSSEGETAVYRSADARFVFVRLPKDAHVAPFLLILAAGTIAALLLAILLSWRLARVFSKPVEGIVAGLTTGDELPYGEISELKSLAERISSYRRDRELMLARANTFAQDVSHELRTPVTILSGALELIEADDRRNVPETWEPRLARMRRATDSLSLTIEVLLYLSSAERRIEVEDFTSALSTVVEQQRELAHAGVRVEMVVDEHPESSYEWAPLVVALQTLLANAVRATRSGRVRVLVGAYSAEVEDTGPGMADSELRHARSNSFDSARLGFAIVHKVCERCDWALQITSSATGLLVAIRFHEPYLKLPDTSDERRE